MLIEKFNFSFKILVLLYRLKQIDINCRFESSKKEESIGIEKWNSQKKINYAKSLIPKGSIKEAIGVLKLIRKTKEQEFRLAFIELKQNLNEEDKLFTQKEMGILTLREDEVSQAVLNLIKELKITIESVH